MSLPFQCMTKQSPTWQDKLTTHIQGQPTLNIYFATYIFHTYLLSPKIIGLRSNIAIFANDVDSKNFTKVLHLACNTAVWYVCNYSPAQLMQCTESNTLCSLQPVKNYRPQLNNYKKHVQDITSLKCKLVLLMFFVTQRHLLVPQSCSSPLWSQ